MPQHSTPNQGDYLLSLWAAKFEAGFSPEALAALRAGFQQDIVTPEIPKEFPIPTATARGTPELPFTTVGPENNHRWRIKDPPLDPPSAGSTSTSGGSTSDSGTGPTSDVSASGGSTSTSTGSGASASLGSHSASTSGMGSTSATSGLDNQSDCSSVAFWSCVSGFEDVIGLKNCNGVALNLCSNGNLCGCWVEYCDGTNNFTPLNPGTGQDCPDDSCCDDDSCAELFVLCCYDDGSLETHYVGCCACA